MKKIINWIFSAILLCGTMVFTSCNPDDDIKPIENLSEKIIGKWIVADRNGQSMPTNGKIVLTFVSPIKAYLSASFNERPEVSTEWYDQMEANVIISGNKITLTFHPDEHTTMVDEFTVTAINNNEFTANCKITRTVDGNVVHSKEDVLRYDKVTADYQQPILGLWECTGLTGIETYNDANARLEFLEDGTYRYYRKDDAGQWQAVTTREFQNYFVDGTLLATRWKNQDEDELREWWEIASINGDDMVWTALRQNADGSTSQQKMTWKKIDLNVSEKIIGKWVVTDKNSQPAPTDIKSIYTFVSATQAYISQSFNAHPEAGTPWFYQAKADVVISGNKVTVTSHSDEYTTAVEEYTITSIDEKKITANRKITVTVDGNVTRSAEDFFCLTKVTADYQQPILGLWECTGLTGIETYNDANARLEFLEDGTYRYYRKDDAGQWQAVTTREFQNYFVDGTLLATRWKNQDEDELREWWEIESLAGDQMAWTALRQNTDGSTVQQKMTWKRIDLNIAENIIGKWITADVDGQPALSNKKRVLTFVSGTKAYISSSLNANPDMASQWNDKVEADVTINGNEVILTSKRSENMTEVEKFIITDITDSEFIATHEVIITVDGDVLPSNSHVLRLEKVTVDYREAVLGTWEGRCTSEGSVFDDGQEHRWQYKADGTYVYYVKDGDNWVPYEGNTLNEYFVDGNLLCTRWIDLGQENREWWEINIDGNKMNWTALRQKEDGSTFTATFEMTLVSNMP